MHLARSYVSSERRCRARLLILISGTIISCTPIAANVQSHLKCRRVTRFGFATLDCASPETALDGAHSFRERHGLAITNELKVGVQPGQSSFCAFGSAVLHFETYTYMFHYVLAILLAPVALSSNLLCFHWPHSPCMRTHEGLQDGYKAVRRSCIAVSVLLA
jgi:hypothetical protein